MNKQQLDEVVRLHKLWLDCDIDGVRANLSGVDLTNANLTRANLTRADLFRANLIGIIYEYTLPVIN